MQAFQNRSACNISEHSKLRLMYDIYYDRREDFDLHELFCGNFVELLDHISDLQYDECINIEYYEVI